MTTAYISGIIILSFPMTEDRATLESDLSASWGCGGVIPCGITPFSRNPSPRVSAVTPTRVSDITPLETQSDKLRGSGGWPPGGYVLTHRLERQSIVVIVHVIVGGIHIEIRRVDIGLLKPHGILFVLLE